MFAKKLRANSNTPTVRAQVQGVVRGIDAAIATAHADGQSSAVVDLPTSVSIKGMTPSDSRLVLYSELIKFYGGDEPEGRGFDVKMVLEPEPQMILEWHNGLADDDFKERNALIKKHLVRSSRGAKKSPYASW